MFSSKLYSYWLSLGTDGQSYRHARWFSLVHVQNRWRNLNCWLRRTIHHWSTPSPTGVERACNCVAVQHKLPSASWSARGEPSTIVSDFFMAARHLQWWKTHPLCLIATRTAPGHAHSIAEQILLLLSTTVSEACWTTVTHAWHDKEVVKYFWNKIKKTITGPLWVTTPLLSNFRARPQSLANCLRAVPSSYNQQSLEGMDTKNKQTKPMKKRLTLSAITSVTFEIMKTTSPHSTQKKSTRVQSCSRRW